MQNQKVLQAISKRLIPNQMVVDVFQVELHEGQKSVERSLAVTNRALYVYEGSSLKKSLSIAQIVTITLAAFSRQLSLHSEQSCIRVSTNETATFIKSLLRIRQKTLGKETMPARIQLSKVAGEDTSKQRFWGKLFQKHHKGTARGDNDGGEERKSAISLEIESKKFISEISRKIYAAVEKETTVLYVSGDMGFIFREEEYTRSSDGMGEIFRKEQIRVRRHSIMKISNEEADGKVRSLLGEINFNDYIAQVYFALELRDRFCIVTPYYEKSKSLQTILQQQRLPEKDLVSLFYKLRSLIDNCRNVLHSLSPKHIFLEEESIRIFAQLCMLPGNTNLDYLAPEEIDSRGVVTDPYLTNCWKIGMLLYEATYDCMPFPLEYVAGCLKQGCTIKVPFPDAENPSLQSFLHTILKIAPEDRAKSADHIWIKQKQFTK